MADGAKVVFSMLFVLAVVAILVIMIVPDAGAIIKETLSLIGFALLWLLGLNSWCLWDCFLDSLRYIPH